MSIARFIKNKLEHWVFARDSRDGIGSVEEFHRDYYYSMAWEHVTWEGIRAAKCPFDLWTYQEIIMCRKPETIIETGTAFGGSALFFARMLDILGRGRVLTVDKFPMKGCPYHPRIIYITGDSIAPDTVSLVGRSIKGPCMVSLDSEHSMAHVLSEMYRYRHFVSPGQYMVVEDTNVNGHPVLSTHGAGPKEAVDVFMQKDFHRWFELDEAVKTQLLSFNTYLRKVQQ